MEEPSSSQESISSDLDQDQLDALEVSTQCKETQQVMNNCTVNFHSASWIQLLKPIICIFPWKLIEYELKVLKCVDKLLRYIFPIMKLLDQSWSLDSKFTTTPICCLSCNCFLTFQSSVLKTPLKLATSNFSVYCQSWIILNFNGGLYISYK